MNILEKANLRRSRLKIITVLIATGFILGACTKSSPNESQVQQTEESLEEAATIHGTEDTASKNDGQKNSIENGELDVVNADGFGNPKEVLENMVITSNVEVIVSQENELEIEFYLENVGVCTFAASKGKELSLPEEDFVDSTKIEWTALTADDEYIFPYMKENEAGDMFMIDWTYNEYHFAIYGKSPQDTENRDYAGKIALAIIRNLSNEEP